MMGEIEDLILLFFVVWSVNYVLAQSLEHEGSMCVHSDLLGKKLKFLRLHPAVLIIRSQLGSKCDYPTTMFS